MNQPAKLQFMEWHQAQKQVLEVKADALLQINPSEKRKRLYDF
jgi:hypothetical protein